LSIRPFLILLVVFFLAVTALNRDMLIRPRIRYLDEIKLHCRELGEDLPLVLAVIQTESRFREDAVSPKGAVGLMQVTPDTGRWMAERLGLDGFTEERLYERQWNLTIGISYIQYLRRQFPDNLTQVVAAYNAGPTRVRGWLDTGEWDGSLESADHIPYPETRAYVRKVLSAYAYFSENY